MAVKPEIPYGKRLVSNTIREIADETPKKLFACIPRTNDIRYGFKDVHYEDFARAIDRVTWWLDSLIGISESFETLAYIGPFDLRYFILFIAIPKLRYKYFVPSPRNSLAAQLHLFHKTSCNILISASSSKVQDYLDSRSMRHIFVPELEELLQPGDVAPYPYFKTFEEVKNDLSLVLHTSGSTGMPKPVFLTHQWLSGNDATSQIDLCNGYPVTLANFSGSRVFCCLPPFHAASIMGSLTTNIFWDAVSIWPPSNRPLSAPLVDEMLDSVDVEILFCPPSILEDLSQSQDSIKRLSKLKAAHYGGGPVSHHAGEILRRHVLLCSMIGSTEAANMPFHQTSSENWEYFHVDPELRGFEFRPATDDLFEMVIVRHPSTDHVHSVFTTFPNITEYPMNDLYQKHPTEPNHWLYIGRADDVIVLSNGEKLSPVAMEAVLRDHPDVQGAVMIGQGKFSTGALIEVTKEFNKTMITSEDRAHFVETLLPYIAEANDTAPAHAHLAIDKILIASPDKPFPRAGKGTVQRAGTVNLFENEIEELYQRTELSTSLKVPQMDLGKDSAAIEAELKDMIAAISNIRLQTATQDFFSAGMDSLVVMQLAKHLKSALASSKIPQDKINSRIIYTDSTLEKLSGALKKLSAGKTTAQ